MPNTFRPRDARFAAIGVGGGLYIASGVVTLSNNTKVVANYATTSNNNIYGPYTT